MFLSRANIMLLLAVLLQPFSQQLELSPVSTSSSDLKVSGALPALPVDAVRFIRRSELEQLPMVSYRVTDDANFPRPVEIRGVPLEELLHALNVSSESVIVAAVCDDGYEAHYSPQYRHTHGPILVTQVNGKEIHGGTRASDDGAYGPYLVSHASFHPSYRVLGQDEEAQIPNGVVELRILKQKDVLAAIAPRGHVAPGSEVEQGYKLAGQYCFRCHNAGEYGGHKANVPWGQIANEAARDPKGFMLWVRNPQAVDPAAEMPPSADYSEAMLHAVMAYFQSFAAPMARRK
ncbi:hypothetical protein [Silvibacterium dinghuense]|uniref:Cytochrome c domain-containing protein n=1 Tax=Silvibacterium dinghuense TaxID=1560006 RepID=A0A4Q1SHB4_9BACT|nr:hypothetical protein [Silvibacterium dinghuense]RXS96936.1 hypothetical protein ESZ00_03085 [Silvibacterium dinghuense]GGG94826.1 hypothetical protein GCM10011586_07250 [Silvibacterium dinghuense]